MVAHLLHKSIASVEVSVIKLNMGYGGEEVQVVRTIRGVGEGVLQHIMKYKEFCTASVQSARGRLHKGAAVE